jgi:hypothetical protein
MEETQQQKQMECKNKLLETATQTRKQQQQEK